MNILIIDDDPNARKTLGKILKARGLEVEEAGTGAEAVALCRAKFINLALIDVRLPDTSGLELLKMVREINEDTIAIMITAYASLDSSVEAMNNGAYSYITKPVNMDQTLHIVEKAFEKQRLSLENKRLIAELTQANETLKEMDERKSAFVANVSHEFKSPLAVISEAINIVIDGLVGDVNPKQKEFLSGAKSTIGRLIRLINDLLDISKIESGKVEMRMEDFDIATLVKEILVNYENEGAKKEISLKRDLQENAGVILADRDKISQLVINLLNNAIKYTPSGGEVGIKLIATEDEIRFEISDTGPGIPEEYKDKIFDKFERITAEKVEGTGLGLPIAKDIVLLHRGRIWVESPAWENLSIGRCGSKFVFILPRNFRKQ